MNIDSIFRISEYFESIQGEGNFAGANSLFIRFQLCNLTCSWCDTKYTWNSHSGKFREFERNEIVELIRESKPPHVIFTGGEPTLYRLDRLVTEGKKFHVETNATIIPTKPVCIQISDGTEVRRDAMDESVISKFNWVVSPKLSNSYQRINKEAIGFWAERKWGIFKFIAKNSDDISEISTFVHDFEIEPAMTYIGLEGTTVASQLRTNLVEEIIQHGFNFSARLHILLWQDERGK